MMTNLDGHTDFLPAGLQPKLARHRRFWAGEGPSLMFMPTGRMDQYDTGGYAQRFENPRLMWEAEMRRAAPVVDWPTDGIPTVRPNLGVIFVSGIAGAGYQVNDGQMPWPGDPLSRERIRELPNLDVAQTKLMRLAAEFYAIYREQRCPVVAYAPDTQGTFDIAHLIYGEDIFLELPEDQEWIRELMDICLGLHVCVTQHVKSLMGEPATMMVHGHGTQQGLYFPEGGARASEDTCTLLSPQMLRDSVLPYVDRGLEAFGGGFVHYCGRHPFLFEALCASPAVKAIDLGNSEAYDLRWLLERCAATQTVLYSRVAARPGEEWPAYTRRLGTLTKEVGARVVLRPMVFPDSREECATMLDLWRELTAV